MGTAEGGGSAGSGLERPVVWVQREEIVPFSPAPGVYVQPMIGESMMTCWIALEPGAVVADHSHLNEQSGVVIEGSIDLTAAGETRTVTVGGAYVLPPHVRHSGTAGPDGVVLVETFVPVREEYERAWRAAMENHVG